MTHFLTTQINHHGYLAIFFLMLLESACIPIPSEVIMLFGGALAGGLLATAGHAHVGLFGVGLAGALGNLAGSLVAYAVGRAGGRPLLERYGRHILIQPEHIDRAEAFFRRRGDVAVLVGRVLPVVRTFVSLPAGIAEMPVGRFTLYTLVGCLPWTFALAGVGYAVAANWHSVASAFSYVSIVFAVVIVAAIGWWVLRRVRSRADADRGATGRPLP
ncbi:MAG: DedA family protein [Acidimicrobiales bacterium]|nr:DedA family protein [Acidimicrobiales bacterium]